MGEKVSCSAWRLRWPTSADDPLRRPITRQTGRDRNRECSHHNVLPLIKSLLVMNKTSVSSCHASGAEDVINPVFLILAHRWNKMCSRSLPVSRARLNASTPQRHANGAEPLLVPLKQTVNTTSLRKKLKLCDHPTSDSKDKINWNRRGVGFLLQSAFPTFLPKVQLFIMKKGNFCFTKNVLPYLETAI